MACRTCHHLEVKPDRSGRVVPRKGWTYTCLARVPDINRIVPASVSTAHGWASEPRKRSMSPDDGEGCPAYTARGGKK